NPFNTQVLKLKGKEEIPIKNRDKRRKRKRGALKDYLKNKLGQLKPKPNKGPVSNLKSSA
ncbi:hypothetical protein, partial [Priestia megaterium]|uniref:hypothetical protein n=1 Tax=Priestia megaterium TaxID=1404 RepID=UPI001B7D72E8